LVLPFGVVPEFAKVGQSLQETAPLIAPYFIWLAVPFTTIVSWVFHTMQRISSVGENPFEGSANDVPISSMARGMEIDLREMLDEENIPKPYPIQHNVQM
jgi:putative membrane protein